MSMACERFDVGVAWLEPIVAQLDATVATTVPDLPGFAESPPLPHDAHDIAGYAAWARDLLDAVAPAGDAVLAGHSFGSIVAAAASCDEVVLGALLNLEAVAERARGSDTIVLCAGYKGVFAIDDAYCAGRIVQLLEAERTDSAVASAVVAERFPNAIDGINARSYGPPGLEEDIAWCAQVSVLDVVPRLSRMVGPAAEIVA